MSKDRIVSIRLSDEEYAQYSKRIKNMPPGYVRKMLTSPEVNINAKLVLIHENQQLIHRLSQQNRRLWSEIHKELGIE